jgi:outer membrane lipoprotein-sorting protein
MLVRGGVVAVVLSVCVRANAQSVDEVLAKHVEALGGIENLRAIRSVRMSGRVVAGGGREALVTREVARPGRVRTEFTYQGVTGVYAFDGKRGWNLSPFDGSFEPAPMEGDAERQVADQADFEGPLVDWKAKGHQVLLAGKETLEGREVYKLDVTLRSGRVLHQFLDAESFLLVRTRTTRQFRGRSIEVDTEFDDYREAAGMLFAHRIETGAVERPQRLTVTIETIEVNPTLEDKRFEMPTPGR